jgi:nucleotide-binding universal stress UspA family protein
MNGSHLLKKLLLVVDGSEESVAAAHYAIQLAAQIGGELEAVYVVDTATMDYLMQMHIFVDDERHEFQAELEQSGKRYLELVQALAHKQGLTVATHLLHGGFHQRVLQVAQDRGCDALVLGGWSDSLTRKDLAGTERQLVLSHADCLILIVRHRPPPPFAGRGEKT